MTGEYGLENVVLSIPAVVDENGIETVVPIELMRKNCQNCSNRQLY